jgi:Polyketide cyclase / dehydrase and lipid transport
MTRFSTQVVVAAPVQQVWDQLTDWSAHGRWIPLTDVRVLTAPPPGAGTRFVGRTHLGPIGFDDPMEVTVWAPPDGDLPGRCGVVKQGRLVLGGTDFEVAADPASGGSIVRWSQDLRIAPPRLTRFAGPLIALAGRAAYTRTLRRMAREIESGAVRP